jgi:Flp pilus assembly protein CpaB
MISPPSRFLPLSTVLVLIVALPAGAQLAAEPMAVTAARRAAVRATALSTILGNALNWSNGTLPDTPVRVRDLQTGSIVSSALTDKVGVYAFKALDPGNYVVEIVGADKTALAATNLISANAGQTVHTSVKLPFRTGILPNILGSSPTPTPDGHTAAIVPTGTAISER